jgi:AcrR family transcriptional regulator
MMTVREVNQPQQRRSQNTMNRMMDAATALLEEKSWLELTVQDIVSEAECSVGAFYGRFKDKDGLLHALDKRFFDGLIQLIETAEADLAAQPHTLPQTIEALTRMVVVLHSQQQGLMRTLILQARLFPEPRFREQENRLWEKFPQLMALVLRHEAEINHPDPAVAAHFGFIQLFFTVREMTIWPHVAANMPLQEEALVEGLASTYLAYLHHGAGFAMK